MRVVSKTLAWRDANASVLRWFSKKALRSQGTAKVYLDDLYLFWRDRLNGKLRSIDEWLHSVNPASPEIPNRTEPSKKNRF